MQQRFAALPLRQSSRQTSSSPETSACVGLGPLSQIEGHPHGALSLNNTDEPKASKGFGSSLALSSVGTNLDSRSWARARARALAKGTRKILRSCIGLFLRLRLSSESAVSSNPSEHQHRGTQGVSRRECEHSPARSANPLHHPPFPTPPSRRTQNTSISGCLHSSTPNAQLTIDVVEPSASL